MLTTGDFSISHGQMRQVPLRDSLPAIARAGFKGVVIGMDVYLAARDAGLSDQDIRGLVADNGLEVEYLDGLVHWMPGAPEPQAPAGVRLISDPQAFFDAASGIGAPMINMVEVFNFNPGQEAAIEGYSRICDGAKQHGLSICLEFTPLGAVRGLPEANAIVEAAGRDNGGILLDTWHFARSGGTPDDIRAVPAGRILGLQISDVEAKPQANLFHEAMHARHLPGEGQGNVREAIAAAIGHGVRRPLSAEVYRDELMALPLDDMLARTIEALRNVMPVPVG